MPHRSHPISPPAANLQGIAGIEPVASHPTAYRQALSVRDCQCARRLDIVERISCLDPVIALPITPAQRIQNELVGSAVKDRRSGPAAYGPPERRMARGAGQPSARSERNANHHPTCKRTERNDPERTLRASGV